MALGNMEILTLLILPIHEWEDIFPFVCVIFDFFQQSLVVLYRSFIKLISGILLLMLLCMHVHAQSCLALCDPMDCSPPGSSVHGILQARILEWVAMRSSRGSSPPRDQTHISLVSCISRQVTISTTCEAHCEWDSFISQVFNY